MDSPAYDFHALTRGVLAKRGPAGTSVLGTSGAGTGAGGGNTHIKRTNWWHEQIVDWELMNPSAKLYDCAQHFGKTEAWLSTVRNSDAYREFRARRIAEHQNMVSETVIEKVEGLAALTLDTLHDRIEREKDDISLGFVRETAETALKALGYGARGTAAPAPVVQINVVSAESLSRARELMRGRAPTMEEPALAVSAPEETDGVALPLPAPT